MSRRILSRAISKLVSRFSAYDLIAPYDYVQNVVEFYLPHYLGVSKGDVSRIFIVGGYLGREIPRIMRTNPNCQITIFEPSQRYGEALVQRFRTNAQVRVEQFAVADRQGEWAFHETSLKGSGSLLPLGPLAIRSYEAKPAETFLVRCVTLDSYANGVSIDCLWVDVQGAELLVFKGAEQTLRNVKSIFVEVSVQPELYKGSATLSEIDLLLRGYGFHPILLGLDKANLTGNAFYVRA